MLTLFKSNASSIDQSISQPDLKLIFRIFLFFSPPSSQNFDDKAVSNAQREYVIQKIKSGEILISSNAIECLKSQNKLKKDTNWKNVEVPTISSEKWSRINRKNSEYWSFPIFSGIIGGLISLLLSLPFMVRKEKEVEGFSNQSPRF